MADENRMLELIKIAAVNAVNHTKPVLLVYGRVVSVAPLSVQLDQQRTLDAGFLKRLDGQELAVGDIAAMLQKQGGQEYLILGRAVDAS